jgi:hypothetical protein
MKSHMTAVFHGVVNHDKFCSGIQTAINQVTSGGIYVGDNLFTFSRNLSFMDDDKFMNSFRAHAETEAEQAALWRYNVLCWAAERSVRLEGDLVECACYKGTSARIVADYVGLNDIGKKFYLYDLFEHEEGMRHHDMPEHGSGLYEKVKDRFSDFPGAIVTKGEVPAILDEIAPEKVAFLHLDLNDAKAELGALEFFWDRLTPGASIVFDDYGWLGYKRQQVAELSWLVERGYRPLELPTGQGLLIK